MHFLNINQLGKQMNENTAEFKKMVRRNLDLFIEHSPYVLSKTDGCGSSSADALDDAMFQLSEQLEKLPACLQEALNAVLTEERDEPSMVAYMVSGTIGDISVETKEAYGNNFTAAIKNTAEFDADGYIDEVIVDAEQVPEPIRDVVRDAIENSETYIYCRIDLVGLREDFETWIDDQETIQK